MKMLEKIKKRWGINSNFQILKIFIVFGITGTTASLIPEGFYSFIGLSKQNLHLIFYWIIRIMLMTIIYQFILLIIAFIFGEFKFFWNFVKKFLKRFGIKF